MGIVFFLYAHVTSHNIFFYEVLYYIRVFVIRIYYIVRSVYYIIQMFKISFTKITILLYRGRRFLYVKLKLYTHTQE